MKAFASIDSSFVHLKNDASLVGACPTLLDSSPQIIKVVLVDELRSNGDRSRQGLEAISRDRRTSRKAKLAFEVHTSL